MLNILFAFVGIILTIFFIIGIHESAHFLVARLFGIKVLRFSIGFGKTLLRYQSKSGTEYVLALIPLGGYVKMLDETESSVADSDKRFAFNNQPFYKKAGVVLAGPFANLIAAFFLYWSLFIIGFMTIKPIIGEITPQSIADLAGLKRGQEIVSINNKPMNNWSNILFHLLSQVGNPTQLKIETREEQQPVNTHILDLTHWRLDKLKPDLLQSLGIHPYEFVIPLTIGHIQQSSPAALSSLKIGDRLIAINQTTLTSWQQLSEYIIKHPNQTILVKFKRDQKILTLPILIGAKRTLFFKKYGYLGLSPDFKIPDHLLQKVQFNPIDAIIPAWQKLNDFIYLNFLSLGKLLTGKLSIQSLGGPITIFESAGSALSSGLLTFINFLAFLSISIGIINLLPIPGLDGGVFFIELIEFIMRKPLPNYLTQMLYHLGFLLIIFMLIQALVNDFLRL